MNKKLFNSVTGSKTIKVTDTINEASGVAYALSDKATLAQLICTGTFQNTFYATAEDQLNKIIELAKKVDVNFLAKLAIYARQSAILKDSPAVLAALVGARDTNLLSKIFTRVVNDPKMFRNFIKVVRSGISGKKSFGTRTKRLLQNYLDSLTDEQLFKANVGNDPSLSDCLKMLHPKPSTKSRNALYAYLLDKEYNKRDLNKLVKQFEAFKKNMDKEIPDVPFQMLTALPLTDEHWKSIASNATWNQIRQNLNTFARHNVLADSVIVSALAEKLSDPDQVKRSKTFPYQLFTAFQNIGTDVPAKLSVALQKAADIACENIPDFGGQVYVLLDTSGSMKSAVTGNRGSVTSKTRCVDVAALFASAILKKNPDAEVIPFDTSVHSVRLNSMDSISTNAQTLARFGGGGTDCGCAIAELNRRNAKANLVIMISDNESWSNGGRSYYQGTSMANEWNKFKSRNPKAKLVNLDIQPYPSTQINTQKDVLNLGGFSDQVFSVIAKFVELGNDQDLWIKTIEDVQL